VASWPCTAYAGWDKASREGDWIMEVEQVINDVKPLLLLSRPRERKGRRVKRAGLPSPVMSDVPLFRRLPRIETTAGPQSLTLLSLTPYTLHPSSSFLHRSLFVRARFSPGWYQSTFSSSRAIQITPGSTQVCSRVLVRPLVPPRPQFCR